MAQLNAKKTITDFGVFIKYAREKQELKQSDVAKMVGISQPYYCKIEAGNREVSMTLALNICDALGVDFNAFIRFISMKKPSVVRSKIKIDETENSPPQ